MGNGYLLDNVTTILTTVWFLVSAAGGPQRLK